MHNYTDTQGDVWHVERIGAVHRRSMAWGAVRDDYEPGDGSRIYGSSEAELLEDVESFVSAEQEAAQAEFERDMAETLRVERHRIERAQGIRR